MMRLVWLWMLVGICSVGADPFEKMQRLKRIMEGKSSSGEQILLSAGMNRVGLVQMDLILLLHPLQRRLGPNERYYSKRPRVLPEPGFFEGWQDLVRGQRALSQDVTLLETLQDEAVINLLSRQDSRSLRQQMFDEIETAMQAVSAEEKLSLTLQNPPREPVLAPQGVDISCMVLETVYRDYASLQFPARLCETLQSERTRL